MKDQAPSKQEIQEVVSQFNNSSHQELHDCGFFQDQRKMVIAKKMTQILISYADNSNKEKIWKYCKKLTTYTHAPFTLNEYKRMLQFSNDKSIVDTIIQSLQNNDKCLSDELISGPVEYFYVIATISQSSYRRQDIIELLSNVYAYFKQYHNDDLPVLQRNFDILKTEWPDLNNILNCQSPICDM